MGAKRRHKPSNRFWVTYSRSYLVTLGLALITLAVFIWMREGDTFSRWPTWSYFLFFGFPTLGMVLIGVGLFARRNQVEKWADYASRHEASIVLMMVAVPVYLLLSILRSDED